MTPLDPLEAWNRRRPDPPDPHPAAPAPRKASTMKPSARRRGYTSLACCAKVETDRKPPPRGSPKDGATSHPTRENASPKTSQPPRARNRNRLRGRGHPGRGWMLLDPRGRPAGRGRPGRGWMLLDPRGRPARRGSERRRAVRRRANRATGIPASPGTESAPRLHPRRRASRARRGRRTMRWRPEWYRRRTTRSGGDGIPETRRLAPQPSPSPRAGASSPSPPRERRTEDENGCGDDSKN